MRRLLFLTTALLWVPCAHAQQAIPDTIVTATRIPTEAERVPAAVTVLTREDIAERGYQTLAEAMRAIPGLNLVQQGGPGQNATAFLRGAAGRHVLVLLDGAPLNDASEPNGAFNFGNELLGDIERIEVVRGPASALYGSGALGGVVNLVTRRAPPGTPAQLFGELAAGTQRTGRGVLGAAGNDGRFDWMVTGQALTTRGFNVVPRRMATNRGERDGLEARAATARLGFRPDAGSRVEALLRWRRNRTELDDAPFFRLDDPNYTGRDQNWFGQLRGETTLLDGAWTTGLRIAVAQDRRRYLNLPDAGNPGDTDDLYRGQRQTFDWGNRLRLGDVGPFQDTGLAFGATHEIESSDSRSISGGLLTTTDATARSTALHVGAQGRLFGRLDLSAGLRHDAAEDYDGATTWRLGAVLALPEVASRVHASAGTAFKAPSLFQRFGIIGGFFRGNPDLRPERSFAWEVGVETDIAAAGRADFATFGATWFSARYRNLINFNSAFDSLENVDRARAQGAELSLTLRPAAWLGLRAAWTITETEDESTGRQLPRRPKNVLALSARIAPLPRLTVVPELVFTGRALEGPFASYEDSGAPRFGAAWNPQGMLLNLTASYQITPAIAAFAEGRNLTDSRYEPANGFAAPGRSVLVGTRFVF
ncbi:TonB-dependent receptor plug domain-containing protein [Falsiroseomonas sp.]|uniref:TonB-dependent receptor plug domain-containing protein n=1 Tax=Falsiroseomonas sp. TaxID=2870721 RepID=UPI0035649A45